jgi:phosphosulfolactate phosphohydrolase-like enzyme
MTHQRTTQIRQAGRKGAAANHNKALKDAAAVGWILLPLYFQGNSLRAIAREMNARRISTPRNGSWTAVSVGTTLEHLGLRRKTLEAA